MVIDAKKNTVMLYLLARREQWNEADKRGARPYNCNVCEIDAGYAQMNGCHEKRKAPRRFGPHSIDRCPNHYLKTENHYRDEVIKLYQDYKAGVVEGWPDLYAGAIVDGVRYVDREINDCEIAMIKVQQQRMKASTGGK